MSATIAAMNASTLVEEKTSARSCASVQPATSGTKVRLAPCAAATWADSQELLGMPKVPLSWIAWPQPPITPVAAREPAVPLPTILAKMAGGTSGAGGGVGGGVEEQGWVQLYSKTSARQAPPHGSPPAQVLVAHSLALVRWAWAS